ncbi:hypothetical protein DWU98_03770 [Dyella monticola]|uniref:Uncharacterized protein n=1 Tax=Dyella monticola TaxID=1927958 RepID=A0A370X9H5_9GAMM|nr:hypothetical protein [Dyella monticola]RDS85064.1 hypothetical protein DWU98_03770 [Dyella monticola]
MQTAQKLVGIIALVAWLIISAFSIYGLVNTEHISQAAGPLVTRLGYAWDADSWKDHWMFHNLYTLTCGLLGFLGAALVFRTKPTGFLIEAAAALLWFLLPYSMQLLGLRRFGYEFVSLSSNLQLLAFFFVFVVGYILFKQKEQSPGT